MSQAQRHGSEAYLFAAVTALGIAAFAARALWLGQDANWDLQNYHNYAAHALLHWRYPLDVGPGAFQAYLNPLPYVLPYGLRAILPPRMAAMALAAVQSAIVPLAWLLAGSLQRRPNLLVRACAAAAGVTSAMTLSEIGTSFADLPCGILVLGGVVALIQSGTAPRPGWLLALAGGLIGAATGLKLTNAMFAPGLVLVCAMVAGSWRTKASATMAAGAGLGSGFLLTGGAWALYLWCALGNPIFPGLNTVFHSPSAAASNFTDPQFLPSGWLDALRYPFRIAIGQHPTGELPFLEPRFLALAAVSLAIPAAAIMRRPVHPPLGRAWLFTALGYAIWLALFSIERYAVALEVLAGMVTILALADGLPARAAPTAAALGLMALAAATRPPDWWHRPWSDAYRPTPPPELMQPAGFAVVSHPLGYWVAAFPAQSRFYALSQLGIATGGVLRDRLVKGLADPPRGQLWTLGFDLPMAPAVRDALTAYGLVPSKPCLRAESLSGVDTVFCRLQPGVPRLQAAADLAIGERVAFNHAGAGWIYELAGWANAGPVGTPAANGVAGLVFHVQGDGHPLAVTLDFDIVSRQLQVRAGGHPATEIPAGAAQAEGTRRFCLGDAARAGAVIALALQSPQGFVLKSMSLETAPPGACSMGAGP